MNQVGRILLVAEDAGDQRQLSAKLEDAGYGVLTADAGARALERARQGSPDIVMLKTPFGDGAEAPLITELKASPEISHIPLVIIGDGISPQRRRAYLEQHVDDVFAGTADGTELVHRLKPIIRFATMQSELRLRLDTATTFGIDVTLPRPGAGDGRYRVLLAGGGESPLKDIEAVLEGSYGLEVVPDPLTAEKLLGGGDFDAAIVSLESGTAADYLDLCAQVRKNPALFNLPVLVISDPECLKDPAEAYAKGASIVHLRPVSAGDLDASIMTLVKRQRARRDIREALLATLGDETRDASAGLYSTALLHAHLEQMIEASEAGRKPLSIALFEIRNMAGLRKEFGNKAADGLFAEVASWLSRLVRVEDMAARVEDGFCITLPHTSLDDAATPMNRIMWILTHTEFGIEDEPVGLWVMAGRAALEPGDDTDELIARARRDMD
ncbi:MAG: diguanylate cyclase [Proteobacteria bacterium]|nr:diguanylate cyclase [Pseudomonadota bacterium]